MSDVKTLREKRGVGILPAFILAYSILIRFRIFLLTQEEEVNLGTKDSKAKEYLSDNTRFSEICSYVLFDGEKVIKPENLKECDTTEVLSVFGIDRKQIVKQKWRDLLKGVSVKYTESVYIVLMGIEAQTDVHYSMPVKTMIYDAMNYGEQVNEAKKQHQKNKDYKSSDEFLSGFTHEDRLTPVITITLYLGTKNWDGPRSLVEMMPHMDERFRPFINDYRIDNGIMYSVVKNRVPFVLTGSIRDDGPLPEVIGDAYRGQSEMRGLVRKCTTIICLATMLHTIAAGNMTPSFRVLPDGTVRPVYLYSVDADEFVVNKLLDRGSLAATTIVTNVQDFITILARGLGVL